MLSTVTFEIKGKKISQKMLVTLLCSLGFEMSKPSCFGHDPLISLELCDTMATFHFASLNVTLFSTLCHSVRFI